MARVDLEHWRRERDRDEKLVRIGDLPTSRLDRTTTELRRAEAAVATAEKQVATARAETVAARAEVGVAQTAPAIFPSRNNFRQDFHRNGAVEACVTSFVHLAHPPAPIAEMIS